MSKTYVSAIQQLFGEQVHVIDRFPVVQQAVEALDGVLRSVQKQLAPEEAKDLKKLRKRWLKSTNQLNVDAWIARYKWRRRWLFAKSEARAKSCHTKPKCAFAYCVHFVDHTPSAGSA